MNIVPLLFIFFVLDISLAELLQHAGISIVMVLSLFSIALKESPYILVVYLFFLMLESLIYYGHIEVMAIGVISAWISMAVLRYFFFYRIWLFIIPVTIAVVLQRYVVEPWYMHTASHISFLCVFKEISGTLIISIIVSLTWQRYGNSSNRLEQA